jgi:hypothetical protein
MKDIKSYRLNTKEFLREVLEMSKNDFPKEMKLAQEKSDVFKNYSHTSKTVSTDMFVIICKHFGLSDKRILDKIVAIHNLTDISEIKRIVHWLGLKLPKTDEEISQNFGLKRT